MLRKSWFIPLVLLLVVSLLWARPYDPKKESLIYRTAQVTGPDQIVNPDAPLQLNEIIQVPFRDDPQRDVAYGEDILIGYTWYDYQHNGSVGKMVARDSQGGTHFAWMCGFDAMQGERHTVYNYIDADDGLLNAPDVQGIVDNGGRSGYNSIGLLPFDERAAVFYHVTGHIRNNLAFLGTGMSTDFMYPPVGAFTPSYPDPLPEIELAWPKGAIDQNNIAHLLSTENSAEDILWQRVVYWRGEPDVDFTEWTWNDGGVARVVDLAGVISAVPAASPQSNKVALAWHHNLIGQELQQPNGDWNEAKGGWQRNNDLRVVVSEDGADWDFDNGIESITKIIRPVAELADVNMAEAYGDTFRPYCDVDIAFDPWEGEDNLYAVFAASGFQEEPVADEDPEPVDIVYATMGHLWFWNAEEDTITMVYDGWYNQYMNNPNAPADRHFRNGVWRLNADRGSIAFNPEEPGTIYVVWVYFKQIYDIATDEDGREFIEFFENAADTSEAGYVNAEIMVSISNDRGLTWRQPVNVTETVWDGDEAPEPGECMSENWASVASVADGFLHIMYVRDGDAGGIAQEEGTATNSPMIYHRIALEDLPLNDLVELPREDFQFHNYPDFSPRVADISRAVGVPIADEAVTITATAEPTGGRELTGVFIQYVVNPEANGELNPDDILEIAMADQGNESYSGEIPAQEHGSVVWYRVKATDNEDGETIKPDNFWGAYVARENGNLMIHDVQYRSRTWLTNDYSPYKDIEVTVSGYVTTEVEFVDTYGAFAIQEEAEDWSGIFVKGVEGLDLEIGTHVLVTGTVRERDEMDDQKWRYMTYIEIDDANDVAEIGDEGRIIEPMIVTVRDISDINQRAEELEGCLVQIVNAEMGPAGDVNPDFLDLYRTLQDFVDDTEWNGWVTTHGLTNNARNNLGWNELVEGATFTTLTGIFAENQSYAVAPRSEDDFGPLSVRNNEGLVPQQSSLQAAYPNPFNSMTKIGFEIAQTGFVRVGVYDLSGRLVETVTQGELSPGTYQTMFNASELTTGVYILRLETKQVSVSQKLILIK